MQNKELIKSEIKDEAIPLITYDINTKKFTINPDAEKMLRSLDSPLGVISVAGMYRTGKSYLLNRLLLNRASGFSVGPTINPCTKGLWIWSKPVSGFSSDGTPINVLIIDTEGIGATDEDQNHDSKIFTLGILLSSYFLFNSLGSIDESAIQNLSFIVNITKNVQVSSNTNEVDPREIAKYLPSFIWVIRDFSLRLIDNEGEPITSKEYLEKSLELQKGFSDTIEQKNKIRTLLKEFFKERDCATLVRPLTDEETLQNLSNTDIERLRPEFVDQITQLRKKVLHKVKPKILNGKTLNGDMFCNLMNSYVEAINKGAVPVIENAWSVLCKNECGRAVINAIAKYDELINENFVNKKPIEESELRKLHKSTKQASIKLFKQSAIDGIYYEQYVTELKNALKEKLVHHLRANDMETKKVCENYLQKNYHKIETKLRTKDYKSFSEFKKDIDAFISHYQDNVSNGPNRNLYLYEYILTRCIEASEVFIRGTITEIDNMTTTNTEKINKLTAEINELKTKLEQESSRYKDENKSLEYRKKELETAEQSYKEAIRSLQTEKDSLSKESSSAMEKMKRDYERQLIELRSNLEIQDSQVKECEKKMIQTGNELEKEKVLADQKIKQYEKTIEELKQKEKAFQQDLQNIRKENISLSNNEKEKLNAQIKSLTQKIDELQEDKLSLETRITEKDRRFEIEKKKLEDNISDMSEKLQNLNSLLSCSEDEVKRLEKDRIDETERMKRDYETELAEIKERYENLKNDKNCTDTELTETRNKLSKELSQVKQELQFKNLELSESLIKLEDQKKLYDKLNAMMLEETNHLTAEVHRLEADKQKIQIDYQEMITKLEFDFTTKKAELSDNYNTLNNSYKEISTKYNEVIELRTSLENKLSYSEQEVKRLQDDNEENYKKYDLEKERLIAEFKYRMDESEKNIGEKYEDALKASRIQLEETNRKNEKTIHELRKEYDNNVKKLNNEINEEREKLKKECDEKIIYYQRELEDNDREKNQRIEELEDELANKENEFSALLNNMENTLSIKDQDIYNITNFLNEVRENLKDAQQSHSEMMKRQLEMFLNEKNILTNKLDEINFELSKKGKEIMLLEINLQQSESKLADKISSYEKLSEEFDILKAETAHKINILSEKCKLLNDELIFKNGEYAKDIALKEQEMSYKIEKIQDLEKQIADINLKNEERMQAWKDSVEKDYLEQISVLRRERDENENKFIEKRRELKEAEINHSKEKNMLEKEKAVLNEKLIGVNRHKEEILESLEKEREYFRSKMNEIISTHKYEMDSNYKEFEYVRNKLKELEKNYLELNNTYSGEKELWESKFKFLEHQKDQTRADLTECQRKFEQTLETFQRKGLMDKDKIENSQRAMLLVVEERYKNQIRDITENYQKTIEELTNKKREIEVEYQILYEKLLNKDQNKNNETKELRQKLAVAQDSLTKIRKDFDDVIREKDKKLKEMEDINISNNNAYKERIIELEAKLRDYEGKRNSLVTDIVKDRTVYDKDKEMIQKDNERLLERVRQIDFENKRLRDENMRLQNDKERLRRDRTKSPSNSSFSIPVKRLQTVIGKENLRTNGDTSFEENLNLYNFNTHKTKLSSSKISQKSVDDDLTNI